VPPTRDRAGRVKPELLEIKKQRLLRPSLKSPRAYPDLTVFPNDPGETSE